MEKALLVSKNLLDWHKTVDRHLPWVGIKDPYRIWLSEIILQQTQIAQGLDYYNSFIQKYPSVCKLAHAREDEVLRLWQGLGYYSRARNLHATAKRICFDYDGQFPSNSKALQKLRGIGPYTASAIASFAFGERIAVVDGNVYRFLSRFFGLEGPINTPASYKLFSDYAQACLAKHDPAQFNQAIMDFGSLICKPKKALCYKCPLQSNCMAYTSQLVYHFPLKKKNKPKKRRHFAYFICHLNDHILIQQRIQKDIWQKLYEPFLIEHTNDFDEQELFDILSSQLKIESKDIKYSKSINTKLTHQDIFIRFYTLELTDSNVMLSNNQQFVSINKLDLYSMPQPVYQYFKEKTLI